jgi:hypothetical protein
MRVAASVSANAAAVDLARAQVDKFERLRRHAALVHSLPKGLQGLHGVGQDEHRVTHSCFQGCCLHVCCPFGGVPLVTVMTQRDEGM